MKIGNKDIVRKLMIFTIIAIATFVAFSLATTAKAETVSLSGGSITTTNYNAWSANRQTYNIAFDFSAGPTTIEMTGIDLNDILYEGKWPWPPIAESLGAQARFGIQATGFWSMHSIHSAIGNGGGSWDAQSTPWDHDDGFRKYLIQNQWSGTTPGVTVGNHQYNVEAFIPRIGAGPSINDPSQVTDPEYNTFDMKITYTPTATPGQYTCQGWVRLHKAASTTEMGIRPGTPPWGSPYTWVWNKAINNQATPDLAWVPYFDGSWLITGDYTSAKPYVEIINWGVPQTNYHTFSWDSMTIIGTLATPCEVWVDDDWAGSSPYQEVAPGKFYGYNAFSTIQAAVDEVCTCGTVHVEPGTYVEQVSIRNKSLKLLGDDATIKMPSTGVLDIYVAESTSHYKYLVGIWGYDYYSGTNDTIWGPSTITVEMSGFTLDANDYPPGSGYRFASILCRNVNTDDCDGVANIHDNELININVDGRETFGILGYGNMDIVIQDNLIDQFGRGGIGMYSGYAEVIGNRVIGPNDGVTPITWAPNGIQLGYGASGLIEDNEVSNCGWPGTAWSGTSIMVVDTSNVDVNLNYVHDSEQAIGIVDFPECLYGSSWAGVVSDVTVTNNILEDNEWGICIANDVSNVLVQYNDISDTLYDAIDVYTYDPCVTSPPDGIVITYNNIVGSGADGLWVGDEVTDTVDATCNWWGDISGPSGDGPGTGDTVVGNAIYCPWLDDAYPNGDCLGGTACWNTRTGLYYCCIQCAIDDPLTINGDTIQVFDGVHYEHVTIHKSLTLTLDPARAPTVIDGGGTGNGFLIKAPNVVIDGFEIRNCQIGIRTYGGPANYQDLTIKNCDIHSNTQNGILIVYDIFDDVYINNCYIHNNGQNGVGMGNTATITHLWVDDTLITSSGHHNMYFSNINIQTITLVEVDLTNTLSWGSGMCFNTQASTIGTLYIEGGSMVNNAEGLCINQAPSTFTQQIWLNDVDISYNRESGVLLGGGATAQNLKVEHCTFTGNAWEDFDLSGGWFGAFNSPNVLFEHNDFNGNAWCGIYIGSAGNLPSITLFENNFYNPSLYGVYNEKTTTVQATCNYWGHNTGPRHTSMPSCTQGRYVYGNAVVKPYLHAAYPGGICIQPVIANPGGPYSGNVGQVIYFTGSASGGQTPYTYYWTLGDGTTSTLQNPTHIYWTAGYYPITLTVTDSLGIVSCIATTSATIVPVGTTCEPEVWVDDDYTTSTPGWQVTHFALLQYALDAVCPGGIVHIYPGNYGEGIDYYNAHVDGVTIIGESIPLTFDPVTGNAAIIGLPLHITGDYNTVNYLVFNPSETGAVIVTGDQTTIQYNKFLRECIADPIGIENQGQTTLDARYNWWGRPDGPSGNTLDANTGRIADGLGVKIVNNGPVLFDPWAGIDAIATASKTVVDTAESILFNSIDSFATHFDGSTNDFDVFWDFGDGVYSMEKQIAHIYTIPGTYQVSLRIQSQDPQLWGEFMYDWDYLTITVTTPGAPLSANADGSNLNGYETFVEEKIQLYGLATGGTKPYTYYWDLGDGATSNIQNPTHIYTTAGTYTATLTVTDSLGATATDTTQITVHEIGELIAKIITDTNTITGTQNIFTATVTGGKTPYTYEWNFGDGITSTEQNPTHIYETTGTYTVTLTVTDNDNKKVSDTETIIVEEGESDIIPAEIKQVNGGIRITATILAGNTDCDWTIKAQANFMLLGGQASGTIESNTQETVKLPLTLAFGKTTITVTANTVQKQYTAFALGPIFLNLQEI